jgi:hypothetical protein
MAALDLEAFDPHWVNTLQREIACCERLLTCGLLSANDRYMTEEYLRDLKRDLETEKAKRPSNVAA